MTLINRFKILGQDRLAHAPLSCTHTVQSSCHTVLLRLERTVEQKIIYEPLAKVHVACCIYERSPIKTEPHQRSHDSVGLPPQHSQGGSANEAQREGLMVDGDSTADVVAPS